MILSLVIGVLVLLIIFFNDNEACLAFSVAFLLIFSVILVLVLILRFGPQISDEDFKCQATDGNYHTKPTVGERMEDNYIQDEPIHQRTLAPLYLKNVALPKDIFRSYLSYWIYEIARYTSFMILSLGNRGFGFINYIFNDNKLALRFSVAFSSYSLSF
ncbi:CGH_3_HP_G0017840.mRNA.1.CDS.1 [Saccharomyces cerevisiae]|nr:CGH_3_HP_G0017840.mRNA.1.CDS.1 [Saccharomyces cerevisiae]CAI6394552.1 CGH_3_HP_G0017840.mRNA.1.CDS.1 [Saccharomyces cerevisiae]